MNLWRDREPLEKARTGLVAVVAVCAALLVIGALTSKSFAWTDPTPEGMMSWRDGVKPWAVWAFGGGLAVLAILAVGLWWGEQWLMLAAPAAVLFWHVGVEATAYRSGLESRAWLSMYDHFRVSLGLQVVPVVAPVGAVTAALLTLITAWLLVARSRGRISSAARA
jgi:hypothetical protein